MIKHIRTIDEDTGEILNEKKRQYTIFDNDKGYLFWAKAYQRRSYSKVKLSEAVTNMLDFARVHLLAENMYKTTNTIMVRVNRDTIRLADIEDISKIIGLSIRKTKEFLKIMISLQIIAERVDKIGDLVQIKYILNPLFFNSSKYISADLYFLFQRSLDMYLPQWVINKFHEIGNLSKEDSKIIK